MAWIDCPPNTVFFMGLSNILCISKSQQTVITHKFIGSASYASGSLITTTFSDFTLIKCSFLHFGQYKGNLFNSVSCLTFMRVLLLHVGQNIHFFFSILNLHFYTMPLSFHFPPLKRYIANNAVQIQVNAVVHQIPH